MAGWAGDGEAWTLAVAVEGQMALLPDSCWGGGGAGVDWGVSDGRRASRETSTVLMGD